MKADEVPSTISSGALVVTTCFGGRDIVGTLRTQQPQQGDDSYVIIVRVAGRPRKEAFPAPLGEISLFHNGRNHGKNSNNLCLCSVGDSCRNCVLLSSYELAIAH